MSTILTPQQMQQKYQVLHKQGAKPPYFYSINKEKQVLYFIGTQHFYDASNPQHKIIQNLWNEFLKQTDGSKRIVLTEGGLRPKEESVQRAIEIHGEPGLMTLLASKAGVEIVSPEPNRLKEINRLLKEFSKDEIMYYYFARQVLQWQTLRNQPDFEQYINDTLERYQAAAGWQEYDFSLQHLEQLHKKKYGVKFDQNRRDEVYKESDPYTGKVSAASGKLRDEHILGKIQKLWADSLNIFIVYGSGHAIVLEPALKELIDNQP